MPDDDSTAIRDELAAAREIIQRQRRRIEKLVLGRLEPVAVVGAGVRFPGGTDTLDGYEEFLRAGAPAGVFPDRADEFDAQLFGIPPEQAPHVGPAERVLLETAWTALEHATIDPTAHGHDRGAVYLAAPLPDVSGRLSSFLGWRGPSVTTGTSALTALHLAVESLRGHECGIALCGGAVTTSDEVADGCEVLVLKRLSDAWQDGDTVLAIVRGTAIGQDSTPEAITQVMCAALAGGRLAPGDVQHVEPGHGAGAVVKVVLQLRAGVRYPATVSAECVPWAADVRRAAVREVGATGAIGVAVLEEAPRPPNDAVPAHAPAGGQVFTLSAATEPALRRLVARYRQFVADHPRLDLADLCHTGNVGRAHLRHRLAGGVHTRDELLDLLAAGGRSPAPVQGVAFLFSGAGAERVGMGRPLYDRFPEFRARVDECDTLFLAELGRSVTDVMFDRVPDAAAAMAETRYAHAALFTLEYALAGLWRSWGVRPTVLIGHGVGEVIAATVAGVFSPADGVAFLSARARLIESVATPGGMAAVAAPVDEVAPVIARWPDLAIAAVNSPRQCVVSGSTESLMAAFMRLTTLGVQVRPLHVATGFHSPVLAEIAEPLRAVLDDVELREPMVPVVSGLAGDVATREYWVRQVTGTVDFASGVAAIAARGGHVFLEIGPSRVLTALARQCLPGQGHTRLASLAADGTVRDALAGLYNAGLPISWAEVHRGQRRRRIALPLYAFDRRRHPLPVRGLAVHPLLGARVRAGAGRVEFESAVSTADPAYLSDHRTGGLVSMPASGYVEILLALADVLHGDAGLPIEDVRVHEAVVLGDRPVEVRTLATAGADGRWHVEISCEGRAVVTAVLTPPRAGSGAVPVMPCFDRAADRVLDAGAVYAACARAGLEYGARFRRVVSVARYGDVSISEIAGHDVAAAEFLPPPILDGVTHGLVALGGEGRVVAGIARIRVFKKPRAETLRSVVRVTSSGADALLFEGDVPVVELSGMTFTRPARVVAPSPRVAVPAPRARSTRTAAIADIIRHAVADLLSIERVDPRATFSELGVDSMVAVDLRNRLESRLHLSFPMLAMYEQPSVDRLAVFLERQLVG